MIIQISFKNKFLIIKAIYYVIEPHYMEDSTPDWQVVFSGSSINREGKSLLFLF
jgi:hypothetical protein